MTDMTSVRLEIRPDQSVEAVLLADQHDALYDAQISDATEGEVRRAPWLFSAMVTYTGSGWVINIFPTDTIRHAIRQEPNCVPVRGEMDDPKQMAMDIIREANPDIEIDFGRMYASVHVYYEEAVEIRDDGMMDDPAQDLYERLDREYVGNLTDAVTGDLLNSKGEQIHLPLQRLREAGLGSFWA